MNLSLQQNGCFNNVWMSAQHGIAWPFAIKLWEVSQGVENVWDTMELLFKIRMGILEGKSVALEVDFWVNSLFCFLVDSHIVHYTITHLTQWLLLQSVYLQVGNWSPCPLPIACPMSLSPSPLVTAMFLQLVLQAWDPLPPGFVLTYQQEHSL